MPFQASGPQELCGESVRQFRELVLTLIELIVLARLLKSVDRDDLSGALNARPAAEVAGSS